MTNWHSSLEKYTSHFIQKGCVWETEQRLQHILLTITAFLSRSLGLLNRGPGGPALCWELVPTAWTVTLSSKLWFPTDLNFLLPGLYHCFTMPTQFNPTTVKAISWYLQPDAPVIYTGTFLLLTTWLGQRSTCNICSGCKKLIRKGQVGLFYWSCFQPLRQIWQATLRSFASDSSSPP